MELFNFFLLQLILGMRTVNADWLQLLSRKIVELDTYRIITFFIHPETVNDCMNVRLNFQETPNMVYSIRQFSDSDHRIAGIVGPLIHNSMIVYHSDDLQDVNLFIDFLASLSPVEKRSKTLILLHHEGSIADENIFQLLRYAWGKKFLDFTVIVLNCSDNITTDPMTYNLNPFFNRMDKKVLDKIVEIFPNKLHNVNEYDIHLPEDSKSSFSVITNKKIFSVDSDYMLVELIFKTMNFNIVKEKLSINRDYVIDSHELSRLHYNMFSQITLQFSCCASEPYLRVPNYVDMNRIIVLVPILRTPQTNISLKIVLNLAIIFGIIAAVLLAAKYLKVSDECVEMFEITQILLGQSIDREPRKAAGKIIFLTLTVIFAFIMGDLYMEIVEDNFDPNEVPFKSYEDLDKSKLPIFAREPYIKKLLNENTDNQHLKNMTKKITVSADLEKCLRLLISSKNVSCTSSNDLGKLTSIFVNEKHGKRVMKIAEPPLVTGYSFYMFEDASPYVDKFVDYQHRIRESGINRMLPFMVNTPKKFFYTDEFDKKEVDNLNIKQLLIVIFVGYFIALTIYLIRMLISCFFLGIVTHSILNQVTQEVKA